MFKLSRKAGILLVLSVLLTCAGIALGISANSSKTSQLQIRSELEPFHETGRIVLSGQTSSLIAFEYHMLRGDVYRHRRENTKAEADYGEAAKVAKESFNEKSFFTFFAMGNKAHTEHKAGSDTAAYEDFKTALATLPECDAYDTHRWITEQWIISTGGTANKEGIPFYQSHLALAEKLLNVSVDHVQLITAIWAEAKALDACGAYDWSESLWKRMTKEVRAQHYPPTKFEPYLLNLVYHESDAHHYSQADETLAEALKIANDAHDDKMAATLLLKRGEVRLQENDLSGAEESLQAYLELTKKLNDVGGQSNALGYLSEVARRRGDLINRERLLLESLKLAQLPKLKPQYLFVLACIAARRKEHPQIAEYCNRWRQIIKTIPPEKVSLAEYELRDLIHLYPRLKDFSKLSVTNDGVVLNGEQAARLLDVISAVANN